MDIKDFDSEDYVLVPKTKAKLSRARKAVMGLMVVGAVAAIGGGGTFASFSASTDNDAAFSTARLALENGGAGCVTPSAGPGTGVASADITNNEVECAALFDEPLLPGEVASEGIAIENVGDADGTLSLFVTTLDMCSVTAATTSFDRGDETDLCDRVAISIESDTHCLFGPNDTAAPGLGTCDALDDTDQDVSFEDFDNKDFSSKIEAASTLAEGATESYTVTVRMRKTTGNVDCVGDTSTDGFIDATGIGCDNGYMNQKALLDIRWQLQSS